MTFFSKSSNASCKSLLALLVNVARAWATLNTHDKNLDQIWAEKTLIILSSNMFVADFRPWMFSCCRVSRFCLLRKKLDESKGFVKSCVGSPTSLLTLAGGEDEVGWLQRLPEAKVRIFQSKSWTNKQFKTGAQHWQWIENLSSPLTMKAATMMLAGVAQEALSLPPGF